MLNNSDTAADLRTWVLKECELVAVVRLPEVTFKPNKINVRSSVLYLKRRETPDVDLESNYSVKFVDVFNLGYTGAGDPIRGFDESKLFAELEAYLEKGGETSHKHWRAFSIDLKTIISDPTRRFDLKYWDPNVRGPLAALENKSAPSLSSLATDEIKRGKSPLAESYVDEEDGYALVVKAGTNISRFAEIVHAGDFIEKSTFEEQTTSVLKDGDVLLSSTGTGTLGKCAVYRGPKPAVADGHVTIVRVNADVAPGD